MPFAVGYIIPFFVFSEILKDEISYDRSWKFPFLLEKFKLKSELTPFKYGENYIAENLFRLTVGKDKKESFLNCIEELTKLANNPRVISEQIMDDEIFTPSLFCQLNNGNLIRFNNIEIAIRTYKELIRSKKIWSEI